MKKTFLTILISLSGLAISVAPALAATTISFSPANVSVKAGQNFNLAVAVNPSEKIYTAKIELDYPADLLEVKSFTLGSNWMALTQTGYDSNESGTLIKTGGYPGGLVSSANFGTVTFSAKKSGSGTISLGDSSLVLNSQSQNVISGAPQATVSISAAIQPTPTPSPVVGTPRPTSTPTASPSASPTPSPEASPTESPLAAATPSFSSNAAASLFAGIGNILSLGTGSAFLAIVVALIIILAIIYLVMYLIKRKKL